MELGISPIVTSGLIMQVCAFQSVVGSSLGSQQPQCTFIITFSGKNNYHMLLFSLRYFRLNLYFEDVTNI